MTKATPIGPSAWNAPKPATVPPKAAGKPIRLAIHRPAGNSNRLKKIAKVRRAEVVALFDEGKTVEQIVAETGNTLGHVRRYTRDLPRDQSRSRIEASEALAAIGSTPQQWHSDRRYRKHDQVWETVRAMLEHRADGKPLSLGAIADALHTDWRYVSRLMDSHGYSRGVREDHR